MASPLALWTYLFLLFLAVTDCVADPTFYSIWPLFNPDGTNADGSSNQKITDELKKDLNNDATKLYTSRTEALQSTWYWYAELTPDQHTKYQTFPGVRLFACRKIGQLTSLIGSDCSDTRQCFCDSQFQSSPSSQRHGHSYGLHERSRCSGPVEASFVACQQSTFRQSWVQV